MTTSPAGSQTLVETTPSPRQQFLDAYEREHASTMRVLRNFPAEQVELRPHPRCRTARELAWIFVLERGLGKKVLNNEFAGAPPSGAPPSAPPWSELLPALEKAHVDFGMFVRGFTDAQLQESVKFMTGPKKLGDYTRLAFLWFLLHDEIHHRGQFTIYLRMAGGKVPSIYGPSGDEPWL